MQFGVSQSVGAVNSDIVGAAGYGPPGGGGPPGYGGPPSGGPPGFGVPPDGGGGGGYGPPGGAPPGGYGGGPPPGGYGGGAPPGGYGGGAPPGGYGGGPPNPYGAPPGGPPMMGGYGPGAGGPMQTGSKMNVLSLLALISGGLSVPGCLCWCIPFSNAPFAIAGIVMGILGLQQVKASNGMQSGGVMAILGIVGGGIGLILAILAFFTTWDDALTSGYR